MDDLDQNAREDGERWTVKLWVEVLVKPVLLMMSYIRAEQEGDWLLHLATFRRMLPSSLPPDTLTMPDMGTT